MIQKKTSLFKYAGIMLLLIGSLSYMACSDHFNDYYKSKGAKADKTLIELISENPDLSTFKTLLEQSGYADLLQGSALYTVWAPTNEALKDFDASDPTDVKNLVGIHLARFIHNASGNRLALTDAGAQNRDNIIYSVNSKQIKFLGTPAGGYTVNGNRLATANMLASNGVLHTIDSPIAFVRNIWEYLALNNLDSIRAYLYPFDTLTFNVSMSKELDYNEEGLTLYDSVFTKSNTILYNLNDKGLGYIDNEDSIYTMIVPTNQAWTAAYDRIKPYFYTTATDADSLQRMNTQYAVVQDLVFRGRIDPNVYGAADSLVSTRGAVFYDPSHLFAGATEYEASNGKVYVVDNYDLSAWESWQRKMTVEAENANLWRGREKQSDGFVDYETNNLLRGRYNWSRSDISNHGYLAVNNTAQAVTTHIFALIEIPNTLHATYNIYVRLLPNWWEWNVKSERTIIRYDIQQLDRSTKYAKYDDKVWTSLIGSGKDGKTTAAQDKEGTEGAASDSIVPKRILLAENFTFPEANYGEDVNTVRVKIVAYISNSQARQGYNNRMLIDCIELEPVH
ncbi:MAG: fasciclin domain-containing protein [Candidatus Symbiothrix sp.]|jgi:uncharacterized surface protein with fasciclin (FAS1) repeats|nr:fasciclin domain-containing protein [Candidatus Symbiothrix sp.]